MNHGHLGGFPVTMQATIGGRPTSGGQHTRGGMGQQQQQATGSGSGHGLPQGLMTPLHASHGGNTLAGHAGASRVFGSGGFAGGMAPSVPTTPMSTGSGGGGGGIIPMTKIGGARATYGPDGALHAVQQLQHTTGRARSPGRECCG